MHFYTETLVHYVTEHSEEEPPLLKALSRETHLKVLHPRMLSGHLQGRLLSMLSKLIQPKVILEIGTYTGYSAICLAEGLHKTGTLHTIDHNEELYNIQRKYFDKSGFGEKIVQHIGDAVELIPQFSHTFDLVFIDADKTNYARYFDLVIDKMNPGGVIISDNVLWSGKVLKEADMKDKDTIALQAYNKKLKEDERVSTLLLPLRDGLSLSRVNNYS